MQKERIRKVYGRRQGRPLRGDRQKALDTLYPKLSISMECLGKEGTLAPSSLFEEKTTFIFEIGFGSGEFLHNNMRTHPDIGFIGAEPFVNGMSSFLKEIKDEDHSNIRVLMDDALILAHSLTSDSLDHIYVLNPDPWPKTRHHKRRMISQRNLTEFARLLKSGGTLTMTTDVDSLAEWMCTQASIHPDFEWTAQKGDDWRTMPQGWYQTRYELKGKEAGRQQSYLIFERR